MSFAPKDEHEAQIQFALERGIPATLSVIGTQKLTFPDNGFDLIHCARCRVHWDADGTYFLSCISTYQKKLSCSYRFKKPKMSNQLLNRSLTIYMIIALHILFYMYDL